MWDKQMKVYDVPTEIHIDDGGHITSVDTYHGTLTDGNFELEQLIQFKGSKGDEVYEGDIISYGSIWCEGDEMDPHEANGSGPVIYDENMAGYAVEKNMMLADVVLEDGYEVIGNIHENPELAEVVRNEDD
ncbi:hypothetical protein FD14_GL001428 [Secundilactobacillus similis DSM 23365 = JCM 2765]|uniref:YopX protein domain-containing protein n=1 Tax=Secundilactobacillus similis DSM 23365 = JCM 2765 TaxID=1423804 RepID=A0A0R2EW64_9LACO|nr:hypothetical protein FD14_GL001428 [Secundilactobacillus similis DSM 23365 = JCM 2765]